MNFHLKKNCVKRVVVHTCKFVTELCVLRTFGCPDFLLVFICAQSVPEFLWDRLRASIQFPVMPKRAQYARFSGEDGDGNSMQPPVGSALLRCGTAGDRGGVGLLVISQNPGGSGEDARAEGAVEGIDAAASCCA